MSKSTKVKVVVKTDDSETVVRVTVNDQKRDKLRFGKGNAKLKDVHTFSLPAGWACPRAEACMAKADQKTGKITDGPNTEFRCFSASQEALYGNVRKSRWRNFEMLRKLKTAEKIAELILRSLPKSATKIRIHVAGDFYSQAYFDAWLIVARRKPDVLFYFYTKSLRYWIARIDEVGDGCHPGEVKNFVPTASRGGKDDHLIDQRKLRSAVVVYSEYEASSLGLEIDHDDSHAMAYGDDFALLLHGSQPAGSAAAKAIYALRQQGEYGYGEKADKRRKSLNVLDS